MQPDEIARLFTRADGTYLCARWGRPIVPVVFGGFAAKELATRIEDAKPKLVLTASCGIEPGRIVQYKPLLDEAIRLSSVKPQSCIILQRPQQVWGWIEPAGKL